MARINEMKTIMRQLKESKNESALNANEEVDTENDASEADLVLARLEDILSRFEKVLAAEEPESEEPAEGEDS